MVTIYSMHLIIFCVMLFVYSWIIKGYYKIRSDTTPQATTHWTHIQLLPPLQRPQYGFRGSQSMLSRRQHFREAGGNIHTRDTIASDPLKGINPKKKFPTILLKAQTKIINKCWGVNLFENAVSKIIFAWFWSQKGVAWELLGSKYVIAWECCGSKYVTAWKRCGSKYGCMKFFKLNAV